MNLKPIQKIKPNIQLIIILAKFSPNKKLKFNKK